MSTGNSIIDGALFLGSGGAWGALGSTKGYATRLFEVPGIDGPRLSDLTIQSSAYGESIPLVWGPQNRLAGNVIWSTGLIERVKKVEGGKGGSGESKQYSYSTSVAILLAGRECERLQRVWCNKKLAFDFAEGNFTTTLSGGAIVYTPVAGKGSVFKELRFYPGTTTQMPDSWMEASLGAGNVPAYRGSCYVVFKDLQLQDYGNALPSIEFELVADESVAVGDIIRELSAKAGVTAIATFLDDEVLGYKISKNEEVSAAIMPLERAYDFMMVEQNGQIRAERRAYTIHATMPADDMAARPASSNQAKPIYEFNRLSTTELPREVSVSYPDPAYDFQSSTQTARRSERDSLNIETVELPVVLTADQARRIAGKVLWERWGASRTISFTVSDQWARLTTGKIIAIPVVGSLMPFRITKLIRGDNGVWKVEAAYEDSLAYLDDTPGGIVIATEQPERTTGATELYIFNSPLLREIDDGNGYHWGVSSPDATWRGASLQRSTDGGTVYTEMSPVAVRSTIGDVPVALASGPTAVWDYANSLTVTLRSPNQSLDSLDEASVLGGLNSAWLGKADGSVGEIIQWQDATLVSPGVYTLSTLLRGRLGTDHYTGLHTADEVFVQLDLSLGLSDFGSSDWDKLRDFKPVSSLQTLADTTNQQFENNGERKRCKSPVQITGVRDGSNNLSITWLRRTRIPFTGLASEAPLGETSEHYEVDILVAAVVVRTIATTTEAASYTAAQQTADGITPGNPVTMNVYQLSETRGRGWPGAAIV